MLILKEAAVCSQIYSTAIFCCESTLEKKAILHSVCKGFKEISKISGYKTYENKFYLDLNTISNFEVCKNV